ncbi:Hypothetical protein FKW44_009958, partial [Caligus rogercresseyi]
PRLASSPPEHRRPESCRQPGVGRMYEDFVVKVYQLSGRASSPSWPPTAGTSNEKF